MAYAGPKLRTKSVIRGAYLLRNVFNEKVNRMKTLKNRAPAVNAQMYRDMLVNIIKAQDFPGANIPLKLSYLKRKVREGKDRRILISTKGYLDSIRVFKVARNSNSVFVGPSPYVKVPGTTLSYAELGEILEAQRPHLEPAFKRSKKGRRATWRLVYNVYA